MRQIAIWFLLFFYSQAFSQEIDSRLNRLENEVDSLMKEYQTVGMSISIIENGEILYSNGFGHRNLEKNCL